MGMLLRQATQVLTMHNGIGLIQDCSILIENGVIKRVGKFAEPGFKGMILDCSGSIITPGFVDCHTHLVFAGTREDEFAIRLKGVKYETIAKRGGGILKTVAMTRSASEEDLFQMSHQRLSKLIRHGTTTVEIKSGYGLSLSEEMKILRVINSLKQTAVVDVVPTYLIHTIPGLMKRRDYVDMQCEEMIPAVVRSRLAEFCDVFCDKTAFTKNETAKMLKRAREMGFHLKIHTDELANVGGAMLAAKLRCVSAEHLVYTTKSGIKAMKKAGVMPVLLPGTSLYLHSKRRPRIDAFTKYGVPFAIASDYNPGTCMIYAMPKIVSLACLIYGISIESALIGATAHAAKAIRREHMIGKIKPDFQADLVVWSLDNYERIPYQFGEDMIKIVIKRGKIVHETNN